MEGVAPLSYATVEAWARLCEIPVEPHEVEALMALDGAMLCPDEVQEEEAVPSPAREWKNRPPGVEPVLIPSD